MIRSSSIGDVVLASACLDYLQRVNLAVNVLWIGRNPSLELIRQAYPTVTCLEIDHIHHDDVFEQLAKVHLVVDLQKSLRSRMLCWRVWLRYRVRLERAKRASVNRWMMVLMARVRGRRRSLPGANQHGGDFQYKKMVAAVHEGVRRLRGESADLGAALAAATPRLPIEGKSNPLWVAVGVGAAYATKQAPIEIVARILTQCQARTTDGQIGLILLGSDKDKSYAEQLLLHMSWSGPVQNHCGKLTLWQSAAVLQRDAKVILANDSALAHIAEAVGVPCAALFGPTVEAFGFAPWHHNSRSFSQALGCRPCSRHGKQECRYGDRLCFLDLPTDEIASYVLKILKCEQDYQ